MVESEQNKIAIVEDIFQKTMADIKNFHKKS